MMISQNKRQLPLLLVLLLVVGPSSSVLATDTPIDDTIADPPLNDVQDKLKFDSSIQEAMRELEIRGAGIAFMAPHLKEPIIEGYGQISAEPDAPNVTKDTAFMLASVSKVFAGTAVAILLDQGTIASLDDDICNVLPLTLDQEACRNPNYPDTPITWRMLATHRSSLRSDIPEIVNEDGWNQTASYGPSGGYAPDTPAVGNPTCPLTDVQGFYRDIMTPVETTSQVGRQDESLQDLNWYDEAMRQGGVWLDDEPGSTGGYSNFAFGYLAALMEYALLEQGDSEVVTTSKTTATINSFNSTFEEFCQQSIFQPLGMNHTSWFREALPVDTLVAEPLYANRNNSWEPVSPNAEHYCFIDYTSGQLYSSASDMAQFAQAILDLGVGSPPLWSNDTIQHVFGCQENDVTGNRLNDNECDHALAWEYLTNDDRYSLTRFYSTFDNPHNTMLAPFVGLDWTNGVLHNGYEEGVQTQLIVLPTAGVYVVVLTNTSDNDLEDAAQRLATAVAMMGMQLFRDNV